MGIEVKLKIPSRRIADLVITAVECNNMTTAWCKGFYLNQGASSGAPWYDDEKLFEGDFRIDVVEFDETGHEPDKHHIVGPDEFAAGFQLMAEKFPDHFADFLNNNDDAITGDVFLQCVALKDVIYG